MKSTADRKFARVAYYCRNLARDSIPHAFFRGRLRPLLATAGDHDREGLAERLHYYNMLDHIVPLDPEGPTVGTVPMGKSMYYYDFEEYSRYFPRHLRVDVDFGDVTEVPETPSFVKSRPIAGDRRNAVLFKLNSFRHFYFPADHTAFADKKPMAVWRGGARNPKRRALLDRYFGHPLIDVGRTDNREPDSPFRRPFLRPVEQMAYRYVISIEGNDVATNLKWILASNALCIMPKPVYETWFMEGRLEAGRHYVEVRDDFDDLEDRILHCERHPDEALAIIRNANQWAVGFRDERREEILSLLVMLRYFVMTGQMEADPALADLLA